MPHAWFRPLYDKSRQDFSLTWDVGADTASVQAATAAFQSSNLNVRNLIVKVASSRTFRYRAPASGEVLP